MSHINIHTSSTNNTQVTTIPDPHVQENVNDSSSGSMMVVDTGVLEVDDTKDSGKSSSSVIAEDNVVVTDEAVEVVKPPPVMDKSILIIKRLCGRDLFRKVQRIRFPDSEKPVDELGTYCTYGPCIYTALPQLLNTTPHYHSFESPT